MMGRWVALVAVIGWTCTSPGDLPPAVSEVVVSPDTARVVVGDSLQLVAQLRDAQGRVLQGRPVSWTTSNAVIATPSAAGVVTGLVPGQAMIVAASEGHADTAAITVDPVPVASVTVTPDSTELLQGDSAQLTALLRDAAGNVLSGRVVVWLTSDSAQALVSSSGLVTATHPGLVTITATSEGHAGTASVVARIRFAAIGAGVRTTCGVAQGGAGYCWGDGVVGQRGDGASNTTSIPTRVTGNLVFATIRAGQDHACGLTNGGVALCWGSNVGPLLGTGNPGGSFVPESVAGGHLFTSLDPSIFHTCGVRDDGAGLCWGAGYEGTLGKGDSSAASVPTLVSGGLVLQVVWTGNMHTCALTAVGDAYCWGRNDQGQLGTDTTIGSPVPVAVVGGLHFTSLAAGGAHTCGILNDGSGAARCWGANGIGQLGDSSTIERHAPAAVAGGLQFVTVTTGNDYACGLTTSSDIYCWGSNADGELGIGAYDQLPHPVPIPVIGGRKFKAVSARYYHTCAVTTDGEAYCWGLGIFGQLGAPLGGSPTPVRVQAPN